MHRTIWRFMALLVVGVLLAACGGQQTTAPTAGTNGAQATSAPVPTTGASTSATSGTAAGTSVAPTTGASTSATSGAAAGTSVAPTTGAAAGTSVAPTSGTGAQATAPASAGGQLSEDNPPAVPNAAAASQYSGARLIYYGGSVGSDARLDDVLSQKFTADTGIQIQVVRRPQSPTDTLNQYQQLFANQSPDLDVVMLDVIWPGTFAESLLDLRPALGNEAQQHIQSIVENSTIDGKLVGMPWFTDFGLLYYRSDLLQKYGFSQPPRTWDELQQQAQTIQDGERASNPDFAGFVFQGRANESLTCNVMEWIGSSGGQVVRDNQVAFNSPEVVTALNRARSWIGTIAPTGVTNYAEEEARNVFQGGNAAFMRNWPYAYALSNAADSRIKGQFDVAPLPSGDGGQSVGVLGGWSMGISRYSRNQEASIEFVRYMTSPEVQRWRAVVGAYIPTIQSVTQDAQVTQALPFLPKVLPNIQIVARPSSASGANYNQVSSIIFQNVNQVLRGQDAAQIVPRVQQQLERLIPVAGRQ